MNPLLRSGIMGVLGFVLFALVWISLLVEDFATPHEAVSLDIYRNELTHNPTASMTKAKGQCAYLVGILRASGEKGLRRYDGWRNRHYTNYADPGF